jgi:crossover junction endodeoxyribonuclease RusA
VEILLYPPDNRRRDIDNYTKGLFDALTHARVWEDEPGKTHLVEWGAVNQWRQGRNNDMVYSGGRGVGITKSR